MAGALPDPGLDVRAEEDRLANGGNAHITLT